MRGEKGGLLHRLFGGKPALVDAEVAAFLDGQGEAPSQSSLDDVWARVASVEVHPGGVAAGRLLDDEIALQLRTVDEVETFAALLAVKDGRAGHCLCCGDAAFDLLDEDGGRLALLSLHNGKSIRWDPWNSDATLVRGHELLSWLAAHGFQGPLREFEQGQERQLANAAEYDDWLRAAPEAVRDLLVSAQSWDGEWTSDSWNRELAATLSARLIAAYPDEVDRVGALLRWFGSGSGRCSGYPVYEAIPKPDLLSTRLSTITAALERSPDDGHLWRGAVRLLAGSDFRQTRHQDLELLPTRIRERLLEIGSAQDEDTSSRSHAAFS